MADLPRIRKLDESVVNRIAAGEVIQRPSSALKELIENSIDAKATSINIVVKEGGLKQLSITDNGCGIHFDDLPILCERHTTSKLHEFEDLETIGTFGFRGEALASLSFVAHLTVVTIVEGQAHGYRATYKNGKLVGPPKPCAAVQGTQIMVEDLFYNVPTRRKAFRSTSEEYGRILDLVMRMAVHHHSISFTCKKHGETRADIHSLPCGSPLLALQNVFGPSISRNLLSLDVPSQVVPESPSLELSGLVSSLSFSGKKTTLILFVNERLVESSSLRRSCEGVYFSLGPKSMKPFLYLNIKLPGNEVDVNVHPSKKEVSLLHEEAILEGIQRALELTLSQADTSRTFSQSTLPGVDYLSQKDKGTPKKSQSNSLSQSQSQKTPEYKLVRIDPREGHLHSWIRPSLGKKQGPEKVKEGEIEGELEEKEENNENEREELGEGLGEELGEELEEELEETALLSQEEREEMTEEKEEKGEKEEIKEKREKEGKEGKKEEENDLRKLQLTRRSVRQRRTSVFSGTNENGKVQLSSVKEILEEMQKKCHKGLKNVLQGSSWVGVAHCGPFFVRVLLQEGIKLWLAEMTALSGALAQQQVFHQFSRPLPLRLDPPPKLKEMLTLAVEEEEMDSNFKEEAKDEIERRAELLLSKAEMLREYFMVDFGEDGLLHSLPNLIHGLPPDLGYLPTFLTSLADNVNWESEKECFQSVGEVLGDFYALRPPDVEVSSSSGKGNEWKEFEWKVQHVLLPALKTSLLPPNHMATDGTVIQVASLENLYKIFERC